MALVKPYTTEHAITLPNSYWRIGCIFIDATTKHADFNFVGYASEAAAKMVPPAQPIGARSLTIANQQFATALAAEEAGQMGARAAGYQVAMADPFFAGATSV